MCIKYNLLKILDISIDSIILFFLSPNFIFILFLNYGMPNTIYSIIIIAICTTLWHASICFIIFRTRKYFLFYRMWTEDLERIFMKISVFSLFDSKSYAFSEFEFSRNLCKIYNGNKNIKIDNYARLEIIRNINRLVYALYVSTFVLYAVLSWLFIVELNKSNIPFFVIFEKIFSHYIAISLLFLFCFIHAVPIFFMRLQNRIKNM